MVLYAGGTSVLTLGSAVTDSNGTFSITYSRPSSASVLYVIASGGTPSGLANPNNAIRLLAVLGVPAQAPSSIVLNELTTVTSAYAMAQFIQGTTISGPSPGPQVGALTLPALINVANGGLGTTIATPPNGTATTAMAMVNTLGNIIAACVNEAPASACSGLFAAATPPGGVAPTDTLQAVVNIARHPAHNVDAIFALSQSAAVLEFTPFLTQSPAGWALVLKYVGSGMAGPGGIAIDRNGNMWTASNFQFGMGTSAPGNTVTELLPGGVSAPGSPFTGGGVTGPGFGIKIDQQGNIWVANYDGNSVSKFSPSGLPLSPVTGFTGGGLANPQGPAVDQSGNIWFPNSCGKGGCTGSVTEFVGGNPNSLVNITGGGLEAPFSTAVDGAGNVWVSNNGSPPNDSMLTKLPAGDPTHPVAFSGGGTRGSKGIAVDSTGNVWVSNLLGPSVSEFNNSGIPYPGSPYTPSSVKGPWGIAVDGSDNIWVADFTGQALIELCGAVIANCPPGVTTGQPISPPDKGFDGGGALEELTQVAIDQAGNVWVANNAIATSPVYIAGDGVAEFIGLATPVVAPMLGPPRKP